ncbi:MAG: aminotransferase class I/II-fold pyridoxal phosphate-dependent enzyme [Phormidesmis sp. FL-bin-119]|nr:aminotransferase class I/II-fold pyridoxal phosphate-dependent enzyme [Pedobacter sp.]
MAITSAPKFTLSLASKIDRQEIYKLRHIVYANELKQHKENPSRELRDELDLCNQYIIARQEQNIVGFISITTPASLKYSVDKYFSRSSIPYDFDDYLYEIRLLTIIEAKRKNSLALALMYASFRWVQSHGGKFIVSICRSDILDMYRKAGLWPLNQKVESGMLTYDLCVAEVENLESHVQKNLFRYKALQNKLNWQLPLAFFAPSACYHGGAFFEAIGEDLQNLQKARKVINADVLDAWFPPSPSVLNILQKNLPWLLKTSPPTHSGGLIKVISEVRGINNNCILPGAGSSDLIFLSLKALLNETSKVLIIDPCYGEYIYVLEKIVKCQFTRFTLSHENQFKIKTSSLLAEIQKNYDMVILVNPNSPTGLHIPKKEMTKMLLQIPSSTLVWLDETYIEYAGSSESMEKMATKTENVMVCKSMSKVYALSGVRAAYLCCSPHLIETLKTISPPWAVSLPAQAAAIMALKDEEYYLKKYAETRKLRSSLKQKLLKIGISEVIEGVANFLLFYLPPKVQLFQFLQLCKKENLFLRDVSNMGKSLRDNMVRIAVKDEKTNDKMVYIIEGVLKKLIELKP